MTFQYILSVVFCGLQLAYALPASRIAGSADINHVIKHTHEDSYYRRDLSSIYARAGSCSPLTLDQLKALPGWSKIQQYAKDTYGDGGVNIVVNPPEYLNSPALVCLQDGVIPIKTQGPPSCTSTTGDIGGTITGTSGSYSIALQQGYSNQGTWTVTQESSLAVGASLSVTVGIPEIADVSASVTTTATFTNSLTNSFSTTVSDQSTQTVSLNTVDGQPCKGTIKTTTCNVQGTGSAAYVASGYVWFNYDDSRAPKNDPNGAKHYKYAIDIAAALPNVNDRSSSMTFSGAMQISSKTHADGNCAKAKSMATQAKAVKAKAKATSAKALKARPNGMKAKALKATPKGKALKANPKSTKAKALKVKPKGKAQKAKPTGTKAKATSARPNGMRGKPKATNAKPQTRKAPLKAIKAKPKATKPKPLATQARYKAAKAKPAVVKPTNSTSTAISSTSTSAVIKPKRKA